MSKFTKAVLAVGLLFTIYGYLCRAAGIYFFWESKSIGWALILVGGIGLLSNRVQKKSSNNEKSLYEKLGIGVIAFMLFVQILLVFIISNTDAYAEAKQFFQNDEEIKSDVGMIEGFGLIPSGGIQKTTDSQGTYGSATINLIVKGQKRYIDITVYVVKYADQPHWIVEGVE